MKVVLMNTGTNAETMRQGPDIGSDRKHSEMSQKMAYDNSEMERVA